MDKNNKKRTNRTANRFERIRYKLMWFFAPVSKDSVRYSLHDNVETWDEDEYDSVRMIGNLLDLWDDSCFESDKKKA